MLLGAGCWALDAGGWVLDARCAVLLGAGCKMLDPRYFFFYDSSEPEQVRLRLSKPPVRGGSEKENPNPEIKKNMR